MQKTPFFSWKHGQLPKGCKLCVQGRKLVLFVTGICPRKCFYCSISDKKHLSPKSYANERPVKKSEDVLEEARANAAFGAGVTGGDPLMSMDKTIEYIRALKRAFGKQFHIHLYTTTESISEDKLKALFQAGLDEIRLHPDLESKKNWNRLKLPALFHWQYGIEIPAIPGFQKNTLSLLSFVSPLISFLNINELEYADNSFNTLTERGFVTKDEKSYAIKGSEEAALSILKHCEARYHFSVHYCTAKLKDRIQLTRRIRLRARTIAEAFEKITKEGTLVLGAIYADTKRLGQIPDKARISNYRLERNRICLSAKELKQKASRIKELGGKPAIVEEYPTNDRMIVELNWL